MRTIVTKGFLYYLDFYKGDVKVGGIDVEMISEKGPFVMINGKAEKVTKLWNFRIVEEYRNQKLGSKAMKKVINKYGHLRLWLNVDKDNIAAIKIYRRAGFKDLNIGNVRIEMIREPKV